MMEGSVRTEMCLARSWDVCHTSGLVLGRRAVLEGGVCYCYLSFCCGLRLLRAVSRCLLKGRVKLRLGSDVVEQPKAW